MQVDPIYGACYTFNFYQDADTQYKSTRAGPLYGLRLLLKSAQADYLPLTESAGVRVAVHGQDEEPFPDAFGYNAAAGFTTSFGIKYIRTKRLPAPYGNCTDKKDDSTAYYYNGAYTVEVSMKKGVWGKGVEAYTVKVRMRKGGGSLYVGVRMKKVEDIKCPKSFIIENF